MPEFPDFERWSPRLLNPDALDRDDHDVPDMLDEADSRREEADLPDELPILALRNTVLFPGVVVPITVARDKSIQLVKDANRGTKKWIGVIAQRDMETEDPEPEDLYDVGTAAAILRLIRMPDGSVTIVIQGRTRFQVQQYTQTEPYLRAQVTLRQEQYPDEDKAAAMILSLKNEAARIVELSPNIPSEANNTLQKINSLAFLVHFIAANLNLDVTEKQELLESPKLLEKATMVLERLSHELAVLEISEEISSKVRTDLDKQQREYILRQQMKNIQDELGEQGQEVEIEDFLKRAADKKWPKAAQEAFEKEVNKLYRMNPGMPDYGVAMNYLEWMLDLPWRSFTEDFLDLKHARRILDEDHYGLEKVKERILEYLAVLKLKRDMKAPILCFYGPPGVGKTSLGKSIARAVGREFVRISLGGVRDESEIRGHRRTYIGALPGRILQGLKKAGTGNPLFMLDEIDKVGNDFRGDPSSALLEVLDPEQNDTFSDHYLELDYDLSPILFIATANNLETIHPALRDRMEIIEINGYTQEEKLQIAKHHLMPKALKDHGLAKKQLKVSDDVLEFVIDRYTRESGVRNLSRELANLSRATAARIVSEEYKSVTINQHRAQEYLGAPRFESENYQQIDVPGVAIGLAWTPVGGQILFLETKLLNGHGRVSLTGSLGDVMKESAQLAHTWLRAEAKTYQIPPSVFEHWDLHVHVPAGAVPKDGPSAGTAILAAVASAFTQRKVKPRVALTGEITLRGKVLPVGGIKEKVLAAVRAGIETVILAEANRKDVLEIKPTHLIEGLNIVYVNTLHEVLEHALEPEVVAHPLEVVPRGEGVGFLRPSGGVA